MDADQDVTGLGGIVLATGVQEPTSTCRGMVLFRGEPLVRRAARTAVEAGLWPVVVVVGDQADLLRGTLAGLPVVTAVGAPRGGGLSAALRIGLQRLEECAPGARGAAVLACDPATIEVAHLRALAAACGGVRTAASGVAGRLGLPVLLPAAHFPALRALGGDVEALLEQLAGEVAPVALPLCRVGQ